MGTAIVLGGTEPHIHLISLLHERGYYVVLVDYLENPVAKAYADRHVRVSTLEKEKILELACLIHADLVIAACIDQANAVACYVSEKLGLPKPYSYETARDVTEKDRMKSIMFENGIPTSRYLITDGNIDTRHLELQFPVVVKPVDANSSKGVKKVSDPLNLKQTIDEAIILSRKKLAIVEEFVPGKEIQLNCLVQNGNVRIMLSQEKRNVYMGKNVELQSIGSRIPAVMDERMESEAQFVVEKIAKAFSLDNTPFFVQAKVEGNEMKVLEFAPRVGGGLSYSILQKIAGYDPVAAVLDSYTGGGVYKTIVSIAEIGKNLAFLYVVC